MAMAPDGTLYVVDNDGSGIFAVAPDGTRRPVELQGVPKTHAERMRAHFDFLQELTVDPRDGYLYVEQQGGVVRKISPEGAMSRVAGTGSQAEPQEDGIPAASAVIDVDSMAVDPATGTLYFSGQKGGIRAVGPDGILRRIIPVQALPGGGPGPGGRTHGLRLAFSPANRALYVLQPERHRVMRLNGDRLVPVVGGGDASDSRLGGSLERAALGTPYGMAFDRIGNLYVAVNKPPAVLMVGAPLP
jgi:sugar lactone lactonase YvrE